MLCFLHLVVDEQNAHTDDTELPSPLEFRKDSEDENRDSEKDEDTKELEAVPCKCWPGSALIRDLPANPFTCLALMHFLPGPKHLTCPTLPFRFIQVSHFASWRCSQ